MTPFITRMKIVYQHHFPVTLWILSNEIQLLLTNQQLKLIFSYTPLEDKNLPMIHFITSLIGLKQCTNAIAQELDHSFHYCEKW